MSHEKDQRILEGQARQVHRSAWRLFGRIDGRTDPEVEAHYINTAANAITALSTAMRNVDDAENARQRR